MPRVRVQSREVTPGPCSPWRTEMRAHAWLPVRCSVLVRVRGRLRVRARLRLTVRLRVRSLEAPGAEEQCSGLV